MFIDKIKKDNVDYDIQDTEARKLIDKLGTDKADKNEIPDLSGYALKSELPTDYITEIPKEYVTETELNEAITNAIGTVLAGEY